MSARRAGSSSAGLPPTSRRRRAARRAPRTARSRRWGADRASRARSRGQRDGGVDDLVGPLPGVEALEHRVVQEAQRARRLAQHLERLVAAHRIPVPRDDDRRARARDRLERLGPARACSAAACSGCRCSAATAPRDRRPGRPRAGQPDPAGVVGLAARVVQLDRARRRDRSRPCRDRCGRARRSSAGRRRRRAGAGTGGG